MRHMLCVLENALLWHSWTEFFHQKPYIFDTSLGHSWTCFYMSYFYKSKKNVKHALPYSSNKIMIVKNSHALVVGCELIGFGSDRPKSIFISIYFIGSIPDFLYTDPYPDPLGSRISDRISVPEIRQQKIRWKSMFMARLQFTLSQMEMITGSLW